VKCDLVCGWVYVYSIYFGLGHFARWANEARPGKPPPDISMLPKRKLVVIESALDSLWKQGGIEWDG
jgi:hypothetical protein